MGREERRQGPRGPHPHLELPARYAAEFAAGAGHDLIYFVGQILTGQYYRNLVDLSDLAEGLGKKYGGWLESSKSAAQVGGAWYAVPDFFISIPVLWRKDLFASVGMAGAEDLGRSPQGGRPSSRARGIRPACSSRTATTPTTTGAP
jgi:ABC-type glycerol-3-phosphate transport system substrate-binding protein